MDEIPFENRPHKELVIVKQKEYNMLHRENEAGLFITYNNPQLMSAPALLRIWVIILLTKFYHLVS